MYFTLEAMQAEDGDSLILHFGDAARPRFFLIDGGPTRTGYEQVIRKRLEAIQQKWAPPRKPLTIDMMMVSHIDADHIEGLLCLTEELLERKRHGAGDRLCKVLTLWFNSFNETLGDGDSEIFTKLAKEGLAHQAATAMVGGAALPPDLKGIDAFAAAIIASVPQGRQLRRNAEELRIKPNSPFEGLVMTAEEGPLTIEWGDDLTITVLCPEQVRVQKLHDEWERNLKKTPTLSALAQAAAKTVTKDHAFANLSSIVVMVELEKKRILLTGDAVDDDVLKGLKAAGYLKRGKCHLDVLKMPHHGSRRNMSPEFLSQVTADHYVVSGDGKHGNPAREVLDWIVASRGKNDVYTIHLTYKKGPEGLARKVNGFLKTKKPGDKYKVSFADEGGSLKVDLLDEIDY